MSAGGSYDPHLIEPQVRDRWEAEAAFHVEPDAREPYSIVIPPPNVTGALHLGHALNNTLQDILIRAHRMRGFNTCWLPGTDHAGIATQAVVEKRLREEENKSRHEIGRDGLVERIWAWKEDYNARIVGQLKKMGCSCDWDRSRFTLDDVCARAVYEMFFRLFRDGLIFRGKRLVNWDTQLQTAVADDEVYHETVKGSLWRFRYPVLRGEASDANMQAALQNAVREDAQPGVDYLVVATTRPETMLGDTAVAVHPDDERYQALIGGNVLLPLMNRPIPVIADGLLVDREFGTGCVKVTPAHDPNDYACGQRHKLPMINIMNPDGKLSPEAGPYADMPREAGRRKVVEDLEALGLLDGADPHQHQVGHSDRSKSAIEPLLSEQWFVKMDQLAEGAMEAVRDGRVRFFPERYTKSYMDWLGEKRDWCISRQLWWGHRIPVWTHSTGWGTGHLKELERAVNDGRVVRRPIQDNREFEGLAGAMGKDRAMKATVGNELEDPNIIRFEFCPRADYLVEFAKLADSLGMKQDPDVLDTWFSSALWPYSTFGWPEQNKDLNFYYPTNVLCTARDIISLWVARMVMTGLYNVGRVPFQHVYIHPVIQDGEGQRMSKSAGNGVDPLDLIQHFGTDAMRITLAQLASETQDIRMPVEYLCPHCGESFPQKPKHLKKPLVQCEKCKRDFATRLASASEIETNRLGLTLSSRFDFGRNLCNKLWQMANGFVFPNIEKARSAAPVNPTDLRLEDRWILSRLAACVQEVDRRLARYQFSDVVQALYGFFWNDLCDWYVELVKPRLYVEDGAADEGGDVARGVLAWTLDQTLRLMHPIAPFITESLWTRLGELAPERASPSGGGGDRAATVTGAAWPIVADGQRDRAIEREMDELQDVIRALRDVLAQINNNRSQAGEAAIRSLPRAAIRCGSDAAQRLRGAERVLKRLGMCEAFEIGTQVAKPADAMTRVLTGIEVYVPVTGLVNLEVERKRLGKERDDLDKYIRQIEGKLQNEKFVANAPANVVAQERARLAELQEKLAAIARNLADLG